MAKLGLQLYTVQDETQKDFFGTIRKVAQMGYQGVEFAGYFGADARQLKGLLDEVGLEAAGTVANMERLQTAIDEELRYADALACPAIVFPYIPEQLRSNAQGYIDVAATLNRFGRICRDGGFRFLYHIHGFEFERTDNDRTGMELLLDHLDPQLVQLEADVYWIEHGGQDSVEFIRRHGARIPFIHLKDMIDRQSETDSDVGDGVINIAGAIREGFKAGAEWLIVEQEKFDKPTLECAANGLANVRKLMRALS